jgi:predicted amidohydrolase YtcJ
MDAVLTNARIYTSNAAQPWVDTAVIQHGRFTFVGSAAELTASAVGNASAGRAGSAALPDVAELPKVDLRGRLVLPGVIDAHTHPAMVAASSWHVQLPHTDDVDEMLDFIRDYGHRHPKETAPYLHFEYYPTSMFGDGAPTRQLLDRAISDRPVLCQDAGDHASWVNTKMLELMGVNRDTPDPVPGLERFARDEAGHPTGHVFEGAHLHFLDRMYETLGWRPPVDPTADTLVPVLDFLSQHGVTALFDAMVEDDRVLEVVAELDRLGELKMHYEAAVRFRSREDLPAAIARAHALNARFGSSRIRVRTLKLFLDGTNELGNSAVIDSLCSLENAGPLGAMQMELEELTQCLLQANEADIDVHIHLVGDRAFRTACDAVEAAQLALAEEPESWRIQVTLAHCELVDEQDMSRPSKLGIFVNWTPHWSGGYFGEEARHHLGDERWNRMYEFNQIAEHGATVTFSSDVVSQAELHRANPFFGMQTAMTRIDPDAPLDASRFIDGVRPSEGSRLPLELLLRGFTIDAAKQLRIADEHGSIAPGKRANLVVLDENVFDAEPGSLSNITPAAVMFEGRIVSGAL